MQINDVSVRKIKHRWIVTKRVEYLGDKDISIVEKIRTFKTRFGARFHIMFGTYWDSDEEFGMLGRPDKEFVISFTLRYDKGNIKAVVLDFGKVQGKETRNVGYVNYKSDTFPGISSDK